MTFDLKVITIETKPRAGYFCFYAEAVAVILHN